VVRWADPDRIDRAVRDHAQTLRHRDPAITRVLWYGSWVSGIPTAGSDVDLCVVLAQDDRRPRDRIPDYLPERFPTGVDLLVLTERELGELESRAPEWHRAILAGRSV